MDNLNKIRKLLEKFYEGQTSLEEEKSLQEYFAGDRIPEELLEDKELFMSMNAVEKQVSMPADLNSKIIESIRIAEQKESRIKRINLYSFSGLAAGLLIILGVYFTFLRDQPAELLAEYTIQDKELAYQEAKKALNYVSAKLNRGTAELEPLRQVNKSMKSMSPLRKLSSGSKELQLLGNLEKAGDIQIQ